MLFIMFVAPSIVGHVSVVLCARGVKPHESVASGSPPLREECTKHPQGQRWSWPTLRARGNNGTMESNGPRAAGVGMARLPYLRMSRRIGGARKNIHGIGHAGER